MARQYKSYRSRSTGSRKPLYILIAVLVVVGVTAVILIGRKSGKDEGEGLAGGNKILPITEPLTEPQETEIDEALSQPRARLPLAPQTGTQPQEPVTAQAEPEEQPTAVQQQPAETETQPAKPIEAEPREATASTGMASEDMKLILEAEKDIEQGRVIAARDKLNIVLHSGSLPLSDKQKVKKILSNLSDQWLFSPKVYPEDSLTEMYLVQSGDLLSRIGDKFLVPYQALQQMNNIADPRLLQAGKKIKVAHGPFHAKVYKSRFEMDLYLGKNTYVKTYAIGIGQDGRDTPTGRWTVREGGKLIKPTWTDPDTGETYVASDPEYPLGSRWISIDGVEGPAKGRTGFAIHGTKDPDSIGERSSRGCIRLFNGDVIEVFNLLKEGQSEVRIFE